MAVDLFDEAYDALTPAAKVKYLARTMAAAANNDARTDGPFETLNFHPSADGGNHS